MKKLYLVWLIVISCAMYAGAQSVKIDNKGNYITTPKVDDKPTGKYFLDSKGIKYPMYETSTGKLYYFKTSSKTRNKYKVYINTTFSRPYSIKIIDEHEVILGNNGDTLRLYFENASVLSEEYVVFIKHD